MKTYDQLLTVFHQWGWRLIPVSRTTKAPIVPQWQTVELSVDEIKVFLEDGRANLGVVLGEASGGLVDIDLDDPIAVTIAPSLLPETPLVFGRASKRRSHYFYRTPDPVTYTKYRDVGGGCLFELRGDGRQTMIPPSIHPSGEPIEFVTDELQPPSTVDLDQLQKACTLLAVTTLLVKHWPQRGTRHETYLALSGALILSGWQVDDIVSVVKIIADLTEADNPDYKPRIVQDTWEAVQRGTIPTNWGKLRDLIGDEVVRLLRRWVPGAADHGDVSSKIPVDVGVDIHQLLEVCWQILERTNKPDIFQHGGLLVRVEESRGDFVLSPIDETRLHNILTSKIFFYRQSDTRIPVQPPANLAGKILADSLLPGRRAWVPIIERVVNHPVIVQDPSGDYRVLTRKGYYPEFQIYLTEDWEIENKPITQAREVIDDLLVDFPFDSEASRTHAVALLIQPFVRSLIQGPTPMYFIVAPVQGTGKTLLGKVLLFPSLGREPFTNPLPADETEAVKYLTSKLLRDRRVIFFDNVIHMPDLPSLSAALTGVGFEARLLGSSSSVVVRPPDTWVGTGNNSLIQADMARRIIPIRLVPKVENPSKRTEFVHPDILGYVRARRTLVVEAICSLALSGLSGPPTHYRLGSFEQWSSCMGRILETAGYRGFLEGLIEPAGDESPRTFLLLWWHRHGSEALFARDLLDLANASLPTHGEWTVRGLSRQISKLRDLVVSGLKVTHAGKYIGTDRWCLVPTGIEPAPERNPSIVNTFLQQTRSSLKEGPRIILGGKSSD